MDTKTFFVYCFCTARARLQFGRVITSFSVQYAIIYNVVGRYTLEISIVYSFFFFFLYNPS